MLNFIIKLVAFPFTLPYRIFLAVRSFYIFTVRSTIAGTIAGAQAVVSSARQLTGNTTLTNAPTDDSKTG
jgi:hypothetical protein